MYVAQHPCCKFSHVKYMCQSTDTPYLPSVRYVCKAKMLLKILLLNLVVLSLTDAVQ